MTNETEHLTKTLAFTLGVILDSDAQKRQRIALAYQEAELLVATIPLDNGDARPRIEACVKRFDRYKAAGDVACAGWMLKAVQERVEERKSTRMEKAAKGDRPGEQAFTAGRPYASLRRCTQSRRGPALLRHRFTEPALRE